MESVSTVSFFGIGAPALTELLIGSLLKTSLVLVLALLIVSLARRSAFATRHFILTLALTSTLVIPIGSALWLAAGSSALPHVGTLTLALPAVTSVPSQMAGTTAHLALPSWWTLALLVWFAGVVVLMLREIAGHIRVHRILNRAHTITDPTLHELFAACTATLGINRPVRLLVHPDQPVPFTCGLFRPVVILTARELDGPRDQLRRILLHELAHVARVDIAANTIARWATVLFWFNPLVWVTVRRLQQEQERACDDRVIHVGECAAEYAALLLDYARHLRTRLALLPDGIAFVRTRSLRARIQSLLDPRRRVLRARVGTLATVAAVALSGVLVLSCVRTPTAENNVTTQAKAEVAPAPAGIDGMPSPNDFVEVDVMPEMTKNVTPEYPKALAEAEITGDVWIRALVDATGKVREAHPVNPNTHEEFNTAAVAAALQNEFKPAQKDGKPIAIWVTYKVSFRLPGVAGKGDDC